MHFETVKRALLVLHLVIGGTTYIHGQEFRIYKSALLSFSKGSSIILRMILLLPLSDNINLNNILFLTDVLLIKKIIKEKNIFI